MYLIQRVSEAGRMDSVLHGQHGHGLVKVVNFQYGYLEPGHIVLKQLFVLPSNRKEAISLLQHLMAGAELCHKLLL